MGEGGYADVRGVRQEEQMGEAGEGAMGWTRLPSLEIAGSKKTLTCGFKKAWPSAFQTQMKKWPEMPLVYSHSESTSTPPHFVN